MICLVGSSGFSIASLQGVAVLPEIQIEFSPAAAELFIIFSRQIHKNMIDNTVPGIVDACEK
jgi:hypothetical protein